MLVLQMSFLLKAAKDYNISEQDAKQGMLLLQSYNLKNHVPWEVFPGKGSCLNILWLRNSSLTFALIAAFLK